MSFNRKDPSSDIGIQLVMLFQDYIYKSNLSDNESPRMKAIKHELYTLRLLKDPEAIKSTCDLLLVYIIDLKKVNTVSNVGIFKAMYQDAISRPPVDDHDKKFVKEVQNALTSYRLDLQEFENMQKLERRREELRARSAMEKPHHKLKVSQTAKPVNKNVSFEERLKRTEAANIETIKHLVRANINEAKNNPKTPTEIEDENDMKRKVAAQMQKRKKSTTVNSNDSERTKKPNSTPNSPRKRG